MDILLLLPFKGLRIVVECVNKAIEHGDPSSAHTLLRSNYYDVSKSMQKLFKYLYLCENATHMTFYWSSFRLECNSIQPEVF